MTGAPAPTVTRLAVDRVTPVAVEGGRTLSLRGEAYTSIDGSHFDAEQLFDLEAGGLHVNGRDPTLHAVGVSALGGTFPGCTAAGVSSPCLVPRLKTLAHERLVTTEQLASSLTGQVEIEIDPPPPAPLLTSAQERVLGGATAVALVLGILVALALRVLARRRSLLGQVLVAASAARRATVDDPTLAAARAKIDDLVSRARALEAARRSCTEKLAGLNRSALEAKRAAWARAGTADAGDALAALTAESQEHARLEADLAASVAGLERIAAALRVLGMRAREHRGTRARIEGGDPVDAMTEELDLRDEALAEVEERRRRPLSP